jgi:hypothetical protein
MRTPPTGTVHHLYACSTRRPARIVPYTPGGAELDDLVRTGQVRRSRGSLPPGFWERHRPADPDGLLLQALLDERETAR